MRSAWSKLLRLIMGIAPPTAASYINCKLFFFASACSSLNAIARGALFEVTTCFSFFKAVFICFNPGSPVSILPGVSSMAISASRDFNTSMVLVFCQSSC
ncbi:MAG: hypothetical protein A7316_00860 [Candidatus Altiarchaeales archaeon WOR_SM1_86-2]|nr:MAG: hypothetical protein A7315_14245 [Candidatus Altiarchaeales archaeon WOR_SM1_79]ODS38508.1 MAG: hypothetical protein A7316_00860 [Candidatus Altiarchaeales archaeon WOR_SM1_86-2]